MTHRHGGMRCAKIFAGWLVPAVIILFWAVPVCANIGGIRWEPNCFTDPASAKPTNLVVKKEQLFFEYVRPGWTYLCRFEARYTILNPTNKTEYLLGAFYGYRSDNIRVSAGGKDIGQTLTSDQKKALDNALAGKPGNPERFIGQKAVSRTGFSLTVAPGEIKEIITTGTIKPGTNIPWGFAALVGPPVYFRHPFFSKLSGDVVYSDNYFMDIIYLLYPIKSWAAVQALEIQITFPMRARADAGFMDDIPSFSERSPWKSDKVNRKYWKTTIVDGVETRSWEGGAPDNLLIFGYAKKKYFYNGGLITRFGGTVSGNAGFRAGAGYEIAAPDILLYSVAVETDCSQYAAVIPLMKICLPAAISPGLGIGVPVMMNSGKKHAGARLEFDLHLGPVGLVMPLDFYPGMDEHDSRRLQFSMFAQISL